MKTLLLVSAALLPVAIAEWGSRAWMHPGRKIPASPLLELSSPVGNTMPTNEWRALTGDYHDASKKLGCTSGWMAEVDEDRPSMKAAFFRWDGDNIASAFEASLHPPEVCMVSAGMELAERYPDRAMRVDGHLLHFGSFLFRPEGGGTGVHVFKCRWSRIPEEISLESRANKGTKDHARLLRLRWALHRVGPSPTRVIWGAVPGMPTEDLAWQAFAREVLSGLKWHASS